ncbi:hypothetical protein PInf_007999 [Phytophthora infestans]|nr:hypothetical protein PInf_007999 [Phytophthora infestans]
MPPGCQLSRKRVCTTEVSSAVVANSADQYSYATNDYDSREVLLREGIKPHDDPATTDSALETMDTETESDVVRRHDVDTTYLKDKSEHVEVGSAVVVDLADTRPQVEDKYALLAVLLLRATEDEQGGDADDSKIDIFERSGTDLDLTDYAHDLAFLPDLTEVEPSEHDYGAPDVKSSSHTPAQSARLVAKLQKHEDLMILSGSALPPPAYGALCDIDVQGHAPIKKKARWIPLRHLSKLYELLKGLLRAGLISFRAASGLHQW